MKFYVYILSLLIAFIPALSHAFAPAINAGIAIAMTPQGKAAIATATGSVIKKLSPTAVKKAVMATSATCAKNSGTAVVCGKIAGVLSDNDINVEINLENSKNNHIDIEYTKIYDGRCNPTPAYKFINEKTYYSSVEEAIDSKEIIVNKDLINRKYLDVKQTESKKSNTFSTNLTKQKDVLKNVKSQDFKNSSSLIGSFKAISSSKVSFQTETRNGTYGHDEDLLMGYTYDCQPASKNNVSEDEVYNLIKNELDGDDITNIYNTEYDNDITINNENTYTKEDINNSKNDFDKTHNDKNLSENATNKVKNKHKDYDIDKIDDKNCDKNDKGEYDKCGSDRDKDDDDTASTPKESDEENPKEDEKQKGLCELLPFICDLSLDLPTFDVPLKDVDLQDPSRFDKDYVSVNAQCPADVVKEIPLPPPFRSFRLVFEMTPICDFASIYLRPVIIFLAYIYGALSIGDAFKVGG